MSETVTAKAHEYREKKVKDKEPKVKDKNEGPDASCCTSGGGGSGADTKP